MFGVSENTENTAVAGEQVKHDKGAEAVLTDDQWQAVKTVADESFKAPASQEELDRIIQKRLDRERSRYSDYDDVKARAERAAELEGVAEDLRKRVEAFESKEARSALVRKVASDNGVDHELLAEMRGDSEEELTAQAKRLAERLKPVAPVIPGQAKSPENAPRDESHEFMKRLLGKEA